MTRLVLSIILAVGALIVPTIGASAADKVVICHVPPGNPDNAHTIEIAKRALPAHFRGHPDDYLGPCQVIAEPTDEPDSPDADTGGGPVPLPTLPNTSTEAETEGAVSPLTPLVVWAVLLIAGALGFVVTFSRRRP